MNKNPDPGHNDPLLDAVLGDDQWQAANAEFKARALGTFQARQRTKRIVRWAGSTIILATMCAAVWLSNSRNGASRKLVMNISSVEFRPSRAVPPPALSDVKHLTDKELLGMFPKGSCVIVEVDGKKQLVFLDSEVDHEYVYQTDPGSGQ